MSEPASGGRRIDERGGRRGAVSVQREAPRLQHRGRTSGLAVRDAQRPHPLRGLAEVSGRAEPVGLAQGTRKEEGPATEDTADWLEECRSQHRDRAGRGDEFHLQVTEVLGVELRVDLDELDEVDLGTKRDRARDHAAVVGDRERGAVPLAGRLQEPGDVVPAVGKVHGGGRVQHAEAVVVVVPVALRVGAIPPRAPAPNPRRPRRSCERRRPGSASRHAR